jgi:hypothetical protein
MAEAVGVHVRTLMRWLNAGAPEPAEGEELQAWASRARAWQQAQRKPRGRPPERSEVAKDAEERFRLARAIKIELEVLQLKQELHSRADCEAEQAQRCHEIAISFLGLGQAVARRCYQRTPDVIHQIIEEEVRRRLLILSNGGIADDPPAEVAADAAAAGSDDQDTAREVPA